MTVARAQVAVAAATLLVLAATGAGAGAGAGPGGSAPGVAGAQANETAGAVAGAAIQAQGESLGSPVEGPDAAFDRGFYGRVSSFAAAYNAEQPDLGTTGGVVRGNLVNLHVTAPGGESRVVSFRLTEDNRITNVRAGARADARIRVEMERSTFREIASAPRPGTAFRRALDAGEVRISGRGVLSGAVWTVLNVLRGLAGGG